MNAKSLITLITRQKWWAVHLRAGDTDGLALGVAVEDVPDDILQGHAIILGVPRQIESQGNRNGNPDLGFTGWHWS